ncbi:MAG: cell division protein FtsL [Gammaproteobacteria bacterium]|nr:cell division protein FtsL [Gammaproteobacteria bacterium]
MVILRHWPIILLLVAVVASALGVIASKQESRTRFAGLERLRAEQDRLDSEWGQLLLEEAAWATHGRIDRLARQRLGMQEPGAGTVVVQASWR